MLDSVLKHEVDFKNTSKGCSLVPLFKKAFSQQI